MSTLPPHTGPGRGTSPLHVSLAPSAAAATLDQGRGFSRSRAPTPGPTEDHPPEVPGSQGATGGFPCLCTGTFRPGRRSAA